MEKKHPKYRTTSTATVDEMIEALEAEIAHYEQVLRDSEFKREREKAEMIILMFKKDLEVFKAKKEEGNE